MSISIDSFGNLYNQTTAAASNSSADKLSDTLSGDLSNASDEELMDVCKDFEAYCVEQVFKEMKKMVPESEDEDASMGQLKDYFEEEVIKEFSEQAVETGDFGIAQMLYEQMKRNYDL